MSAARPRPFVLLATQRTGSSWLADLLNIQEGIRVFGELFLKRRANVRTSFFHERLEAEFRFHDFQRASKLPRPFTCWKYLDSLRKEKVDDSCRSYGFKLMYNHFGRFPELIPYFICRRVRVIHLIRRNLIDTAIAQESLKYLSSPHSNSQKGSELSFTISPADLLFRLKHLERRAKQVTLLTKLLPVPVFEITYEQLRENTEQALAALLDWLGIEADCLQLQSSFQKVSASSTQSRIRNAVEIRESLQGTRYAQWLNVC